MFFILSKTIGVLVLPSSVLILLGLAGVVMLGTRWRRTGTRLAALSIVMLALVGFLPAGSLLTNALEQRFPLWTERHGPPDGIIVLGGAIASNRSHDRGETSFGGEAERIFAMAKLARAYPTARIVYSGGGNNLRGDGPAETEFLRPLLGSLGIASARVMLESQSRNTAENAAFTKELVMPKSGERWLLVTSAQHMPRAVGCFRRVGFTVEAYPAGWRSLTDVSLWPRGRFAENLERLDLAANEWIGLIAYWLTGKTNTLLPSP